jgi:hypothetical protein
MAESVSVRCPVCGREHTYTAPVFPCACGTPIAVPVLPGAAPEQLRHRSWDDSWVGVRCPDCGRHDQWPRPEFGCDSCGTVVRLAVDTAAAAGRAPGTADAPVTGPGPGRPGAPAAPRQPVAQHGPRPSGTGDSAAPAPPSASATAATPAAGPVPMPRRPPFRPVTIRTARDAVTAAGQYLRWLGFDGVRPAGDRTATGVDLRGAGVVAQVDPTTRPTRLRDVECLWLNCLNEDAVGAFFSLAGYAVDARDRADRLAVPLFVMDLTGTPQPVNDAADTLIRTGPPH